MASRLNASYVSILQRFCDVFAIYGALYVVFNLNSLEITHQAMLVFLSMVSFFQLIGGLTDFYRSWRGVSLFNELVACSKNIFFSSCLLLPFVWIYSEISLVLLVQYFCAVLLLMSCMRVAVRVIYAFAFKIFRKSRNVLIIGDSERALRLFRDLKNSEWIGFNPLGIYTFNHQFDSTEFNGSINDAVGIIQSQEINQVYVVTNQENISQVDNLLKILSDTTCSTVIVPELFSYDFLYSRVEDINGTPIIPIIDTRIKGINIFLKRVEDICVASTILVLISPVLLCIAIAIKLNSKGPVFFKQIRYGLNGKPILVYKFRSMSVMENGAKVTQAVKNDPRVTKVGAFLRKTSLDELPQFINVVLGNMSVVGPRPHAAAHNEEYRKLITGYMLRHKVKPGITGLAQIRGWRGETDTLDKMEKRVECDLEYIRTWSILLDIKIIFLTIFKGFINKAAY
ncbi:undecaprenyl-phosphate glucose phosphotransferase [Acinetobacter johnsonii]|uniref:undecaprenyl-phosphate glucose phosphotransferase n=1 Tax=Acinetobacter johnsonii TaxID=40214 RepID=UPI00191D25A9|nr:undecaprenyl-phosphate glucose phosphotransferase [Acinetobacter johnsonii]QQV10610.1 undecaprenyl-phosphate glucose phosphotransferase [Acinetobacter johnsonii]